MARGGKDRLGNAVDRRALVHDDQPRVSGDVKLGAGVSAERDGPDFGCTGCGYQIVLPEPDIRCPMCGIEAWAPVARSRQRAQADPGKEVLDDRP
jgi:hypothetical protein